MRGKNPIIQFSRDDMRRLVSAGFKKITVDNWFSKKCGPQPSQYPFIEEVLGRAIVDREFTELAVDAGVIQKQRPTFSQLVERNRTKEIKRVNYKSDDARPYLSGNGFCWVPFPAWEPFTKEEVCSLCARKIGVCRKAEAVA